MTAPIHHPAEDASNALRDTIAAVEPRSQRTYTPTQTVISESAGIYHWTPEGRRLYDFTSGVLVANLGHNPRCWLERFHHYCGWDRLEGESYCPLPPLTAYNAITPIEAEASRRLVQFLRSRPGGPRMEQVLWAASGSEAVHKALWSVLRRDPARDIILATRHGFHGKKGLAAAVTGGETDPERDPRVKFLSFPMDECRDLENRGSPFTPLPYERELESLRQEFGPRLTALITEPYLGGGGSYHPPREYLHLLQDFCRQHDLVFILDEIQSGFGRTGQMFAYEAYGLEPDVVLLGKGLGNGVPGAAVVGRAEVLASLGYGEGTDTYSGNPLICAAVCATIDCFNDPSALANVARVSPIIEAGLVRLKEFLFIRHVRGEPGGMVWGVETGDHQGRTAAEWANECVLACYRGDGGDGIHLLGPLAKKVIRIAPPLIITEREAVAAMELMHRLLARVPRPPLPS